MAVETVAATGIQVGKEQLLGLYRQMLEIRRCEEQLARLHQSGLIPGACHTYVGEEAIATAVCAHLRETDTVMSTHRGHGHALAKGVPPREMIAELLGKATGCSHGRGGSMHIFKPEVGMLGTSGIVGPSILMATGAGYTYMLKKSDQVAVAFFGDGAVSNGAFHEGLNLATVWDLPVLFVCENNQYATEVPFATVTKNASVASRAASYGLPGIELDGNDVLAIYQAAGEAVRRARAGNGPTLLECKTYRTRPHSEGMRDAGYRTQDEVESWRARDPIPRLRDHLLSEGIATDDELAQIDRAVQEMIAEAVEFAKESPWPDAATATDHVFSGK
ncbi:MAG: thiamine pyrophosphate-dependent dehydrogenase E1 component subunit alpha [Chloroflexota bacterium]|nr:thiamine pyrophosphate-dependent dehydrogenase E1 component subunit alpha [Chloroflexota bacterium]